MFQLLYSVLHWLLYTAEALWRLFFFSSKAETSDTYSHKFLNVKENYGPVDPTDYFSKDVKVVRGTVPQGLVGMFVRNGPNPKYVPGNMMYHWFDGDGMLHGVRFLPSGEVNYVRHLIKTKKLALEDHVKGPIAPRIGELSGVFGLLKILLFKLGTMLKVWGPLTLSANELESGTANTALTFFNKMFMALHEGSYPFVVKILIDGHMESLGNQTFGGKLRRPFTAHPKIDPEFGKLHFISPNIFDKNTPFTYSVLSEKGEIESTVDLGIKRATFMHDFAITRNYAIFMDLPVFFTPEGMIQGSLFQFDPKAGSRFGIMPKYSTDKKDIKWFNSPSCYVFHISNAWEDGDEVVLVAARLTNFYWTREFKKQGGGPEDEMKGYPYEWRFNMVTGEVKERQVASFAGDFPTIHPSLVGRKTRFTYFAATAPEGLGFDGVTKVDLQNHEVVVKHTYGDSCRGGEAVFVPSGVKEDDGFVVSFVHNSKTNISSCVVLRAQDLSVQCEIEIPARVPHGFHGIWLSEQNISSQLE